MPSDPRLAHSATRGLMLVSADTGTRLRADVATGRRPCSEFLELEAAHGVRLLGWDALGAPRGGRSVRLSLRHVAATLRRLDEVDVILSDGEHVGIPLAVAMRLLRVHRPHVMIAHRLGTPAKIRLCRWLGARRRIDRVLIHSPNQVEFLARRLGLHADTVRVVPYGVDTAFWHPLGVPEEPLVVSTGREHRDYGTLIEAWADRGRLLITDASLHSPKAHRRGPAAWPDTVERRSLSTVELRQAYARAAVVVVPLLPTESPFGVTSVLEAMAMGKAVIATDTEGLRSFIVDGETGVLVAPSDVAALRKSIDCLMSDPQRRRRLGAAARRVAVERYCVRRFADDLARHVEDVGERLTAGDCGR